MRMPSGSGVTLLSLAVLGTVGYSAEESGQEPVSAPGLESVDYVAKSGEFFQGELIVQSFTLPVGALVYVEEDFTIDSIGDVLIAGAMVALPSVRGVNGPSITIRSEAMIQVSGLIHGAKGRGFSEGVEADDGKTGGHGSHVVIEGAMCWTAGAIVAGHAGKSGGGAAGATGGTVLILGGTPPAGLELHPPLRGNFGGAGGTGGRGTRRFRNGAGGDGGEAGTVMMFSSRDQVPANFRHLIE